MDDLNSAIKEIERLRKENSDLRQQLGLAVAEPPVSYVTKPGELPLQAPTLPNVQNNSSTNEKISLFRTLFRGRDDIYAVHWSNERTGKKGYAPACEDPWAARKGQPKKYLPLTDNVVSGHLTGRNIIGVFPLLKDNTCWFLAGDFDKEGWQLDAAAYLEVCRQHRVPAYLERSRSGNGGHTWIFFSSPVSATSARQLGMRLLRQTMDARGDMDLGSYDRFFPNQDFLPRGGFGNLIAAPLQKKPRVLGNTEFLDLSTPDMRPWPDQWAFLSGINRLTPHQLEALLEMIPPVEIGHRASRKISKIVIAKHPAPAKIRCELGAAVSIEKSGIPPWMSSKFKHLASMHNPEFYKLEKLRYSTYRTPRFIKCYREDFSHYHLPRGTDERIREIAKEAGSELVFTDRRPKPEKLTLQFHGTLRGTQERAAKAVLSHDIGVLIAPPGAGKTVMGCYAAAKRNVPTLILSHRKPILEQWRTQLMALLDLPSAKIGQFGGGRDRQTGIIDLAMLQSLARHDDLANFFSRYGLIIVDECHHIPAATFEACLREANVRYVLGLTATPYRRDKLQDIITLECGPVRFRMDEAKSGLDLTLHVRPSGFSLPKNEEIPIQETFRALVHDEKRTELITEDVLAALAQGRRCLLLSHWKEHCLILADKLSQKGKTPFILSGGMGKKERTAILKSIQEAPPDKELLITATGQYLGEGFDCPHLDTLFLAFPVAFKGKIIQYVGRIMRDLPGKTGAEVYDYADVEIPVLKRMHGRRLKIYKNLGFQTQKEENRMV